jgi:3-hydroxyisobutyrate dehydrogenase
MLPMADIAFLGLGNMGSGMAVNLVKAGFSVKGFDPMPAALARAQEGGIAPAKSIGEAVSGVSAIVSMLPTGKEVRSAYETQVFPAASEGALMLDCSTIDVATTRAVSATAVARGFLMVDAPVSGGVAAAQGGTLTFMVGGSGAAFAKAEPILSKMGKAVIHAGDAGSGQAAKICNNMLLGISMIGTCEAFVLAEKLGLDAQKFFDIASKASGQCWSLTSYCPVPGPVPAAPSNRDYAAGFAVSMMLKDLRLAKEAAHAAGAATPLGEHAEALYAAYAEAGFAVKDFSGIIESLRKAK